MAKTERNPELGTGNINRKDEEKASMTEIITEILKGHDQKEYSVSIDKNKTIVTFSGGKEIVLTFEEAGDGYYLHTSNENFSRQFPNGKYIPHKISLLGEVKRTIAKILNS